jgi:cold shock CspA family protein
MRMKGKILTFWDNRNYGWITCVDSPEEYFFHRMDCLPGSPPPKSGVDVEFELGKYRGKTKAVHVLVTPDPAFEPPQRKPIYEPRVPPPARAYVSPDDDVTPLRPRDYSTKKRGAE